MEIRDRVLSLRDEKNAAFLARLIPNIPAETVLGARLPALRALARELRGTEEAAVFLGELPHAYHEENVLHALLIGEIRDMERCLAAVDRFLPFVDNWAVCDALRPKIFARHKDVLREAIGRYLADEKPYTRRFGLEMLMVHFLDGDFCPEYLDWAAAVPAEEYYVSMMLAWYFATALAKQYEAALPYIEQHRLDKSTHNRAIQKALESLRVPQARKDYLKTLKIAGGTDENRP